MKRFKPYLFLAPALLVLGGLFLSALFSALAQSLGYFPFAGLTEPTLHYFRGVFSRPDFVQALGFSFQISLVSSLVAVVLGVVLSFLLANSRLGEGAAGVIYRVPIVVPHVVAALLVFNLLARTGVVPRFFFHLGLVDRPGALPDLVFDRFGLGVILAYAWKEIPFIALVVYAVLRNFNMQLYETALNLGATPRKAIWHVVLPLLVPSIRSAFILVFAFSFGAFEVPFLLGPTFPRTLPVLAYNAYMNPDLAARPYAMVLCVLLTGIALVLVWACSRAFRSEGEFRP